MSPSASVCCPCFSILGSLLLLCCSCSSCLAPLLLRFSACSLLLLLFLLSCFRVLTSLFFFCVSFRASFNWNWNFGKFGFYSREGVLWFRLYQKARYSLLTGSPCFGFEARRLGIWRICTSVHLTSSRTQQSLWGRLWQCALSWTC